MHRKFRNYKLMHIDMLTFNPHKFISDNNCVPGTILWHNKGQEYKPEELTWDEFLARHIHIKEVDQENSIRGNGWLIVFCCFVINFLVLGFFKCLGILLLEFIHDFHATSAEVSLIVCITYCLNSIAGPIACFMVVKYNPKIVCLTGTFMVAFGLIFSWFAKSILHMCFTIGVLGGFGSGLAYSPGLILVGSYFVKNRGLANGIVVSGSPVGGMIMPCILTFLINHLGCRGALFIVGGFMFNACVCAMAFHVPPPSETNILTIYNTTNSIVELGSECLSFQPQASCEDIQLPYIRRFVGDADDSMNLPSLATIYETTTSSQSIVDRKIQACYGRETRWKQPALRASVKVPKLHLSSNAMFGERPWGPYKRPLRKSANSQTKKDADKSARNIKTSCPHIFRNKSKEVRQVSKDSISLYLLALDHSCVVLLSKENLKGCSRKPANVKRQGSQEGKDKEVLKKVVKDSNDNLQSEEYGVKTYQCKTADKGKSHIDAEELKEEKFSWCYNYWCKDNTYFSLSAVKIILRNPVYIILLLANATPAIGTTNIFLLIPSFAKHLGMGRENFSSIYFMVSLFDLVGRLLGTFISDKGIFRPRTIYATGLFFAGSFSILMGACKEYVTLVSVSSGFGLATGLHIGIMGVLLQETVGTELLPAGYALSMVLNGILVLIGPYACGYIISYNPDIYWPMYTVFGLFLICGSFSWLLLLCKPSSKGIMDDDEEDKSTIISDESS